MTRMILHSAPASPFSRKVRIALHALGLTDEVRVEPAAQSADLPAAGQNPLGKIPSLVLADGRALYDSRVILEWLDHRAGGGRIVPQEAQARFEALRLQALADGMCDASVLIIYEGRYRPAEHKVQSWLDMQAGKVDRAMAALEREPPPLPKEGLLPDVGQIAVACALGYRDFRFAGSWREAHPRLVEWLAGFAARVPAYEATAPT